MPLGLEDKDLSLKLMWTKFEEHWKPQANELWTHYDLLKQGNKSCDEYYALLQNQLALCQYPPKTKNWPGIHIQMHSRRVKPHHC